MLEITMTAAETAIYDGDDAAAVALMADRSRRTKKRARSEYLPLAEKWNNRQ